MAGAYVALPDVIPPINYPPLWNPDWQFPGPNPPGYVTITSMFLDVGNGQTSVSNPTCKVEAVATYAGIPIIDPTGSVAFTATINGLPITVSIDP